MENTASAMDPQTILPLGSTVDIDTTTRAAAPVSVNSPATSDRCATALAVGAVDGIRRLMTVTCKELPLPLTVTSRNGGRSEKAVDGQGGVSVRIEADTRPGGRARSHLAEPGRLACQFVEHPG